MSVHEQEPYAHIFMWGSYMFVAFSVWYLNHGNGDFDDTVVCGSKSKKDKGVTFTTVFSGIDMLFKLAVAIVWAIMLFMKTQYVSQLALDASPTDTERYSITMSYYFLFLEWFTLFCVLLFGMLKWAPLSKEDSTKGIKMTGFAWVAGYLFAATLILGHVALPLRGALDTADIIGLTATVIFGAAFIISFGATWSKPGFHYAVNSDEGRVDLKGSNKAFGVSDGRRIDFNMDIIHASALNMISIYLWMEVFNSYGPVVFMVVLQVLAAQYISNWSGSRGAYLDAFMFTTLMAVQYYNFVPGVFYRAAWNQSGIPLGEDRHFQLLTDYANARLMWATAYFELSKQAIASVAMILSGFCAFGAFDDMYNSSEGTSKTEEEKAVEEPAMGNRAGSSRTLNSSASERWVAKNGILPTQASYRQ